MSDHTLILELAQALAANVSAQSPEADLVDRAYKSVGHDPVRYPCPHCHGAGQIFIQQSANGRIYEPCACAAGNQARRYCAASKAMQHAEDEDAERRDAMRSER